MIRPIEGALWQWDTGRMVEIRPRPGCTVDEVHFYNGTTENALLGVVNYDGEKVTSPIPNIFLQSPNKLYVYAVMVREDGDQTLERAIIAVVARQKPDDYVYTETEVLTWTDLDERIKALEAGGSGNNCHVTYLESPDTDGNYIHLRDLESGTYILHGRFIGWWDGADTRKMVSFPYGFPVVIGKTTNVTYLTCIYPPDNTVQYVEITDEGFFRQDAKLVNMESRKNLVTVIDETSDDEHYPSAKAVHDAIGVTVEKYLEEHPPSGVDFTTDDTLTLKNGVLSVNTTDQVEGGNTRPVTSAAVHTVVGNIEVLLGTI